MGEVIDGKYYVNNHVHMVVDYHPMILGEVKESLTYNAAPVVCVRMNNRDCLLAPPGSDLVLNFFLAAWVWVAMLLL